MDACSVRHAVDTMATPHRNRNSVTDWHLNVAVPSAGDGANRSIGRLRLDDGFTGVISEMRVWSASRNGLIRPPMSKWGKTGCRRSPVRGTPDRRRDRQHPHLAPAWRGPAPSPAFAAPLGTAEVGDPLQFLQQRRKRVFRSAVRATVRSGYGSAAQGRDMDERPSGIISSAWHADPCSRLGRASRNTTSATEGSRGKPGMPPLGGPKTRCSSLEYESTLPRSEIALVNQVKSGDRTTCQRYRGNVYCAACLAVADLSRKPPQVRHQTDEMAVLSTVQEAHGPKEEFLASAESIGERGRQAAGRVFRLGAGGRRASANRAMAIPGGGRLRAARRRC